VTRGSRHLTDWTAGDPQARSRPIRDLATAWCNDSHRVGQNGSGFRQQACPDDSQHDRRYRQASLRWLRNRD